MSFVACKGVLLAEFLVIGVLPCFFPAGVWVKSSTFSETFFSSDVGLIKSFFTSDTELLGVEAEVS